MNSTVLSLTIANLLLCFLVPVFFLSALILLFMFYQERKKNLQLVESARAAIFTEWLRSLSSLVYRSELEVEIKLIYQLLRYLKHAPEDIRVRVPVSTKIGRQEVSGIADWVVYRDGKTFFVVEAKAPEENVANAREQARSYAYCLGAPYYMLVNGRVIEVHERRVEVDCLVLSFGISELGENWSRLGALLGNK